MKRVVHVLRKLDPGGIETWLLDLEREGGIPGYKTEILLETAEAGLLERDFRDLGVPVHRWALGNLIQLWRLFQGCEAVHSHVHSFSGVVLAAAALAGVRVRVAHSHTTETNRGPFRRAYAAAMRLAIGAFATHRLAVSARAGQSLFRPASNFDILSCARILPPVPLYERNGTSIVIGHVGRLVPDKNHSLLLRLLDEDPRFGLLLCGNGPERAALERNRRVEFAPTPQEVHRRCDCFVFPSRSEGLGLAVIEAQAAGIPCIVSDAVPPEAHYLPDLITVVPLHASPAVWAATVRERAKEPRVDGARERVMAGGFTLDRGAKALQEIYAGR